MSTVAEKLAKKSTSKSSAKQVRLRLVYIDFWSAVKLSFLAAVALAIVTIVSFLLMYLTFIAIAIQAVATRAIARVGDAGDLAGFGLAPVAVVSQPSGRPVEDICP